MQDSDSFTSILKELIKITKKERVAIGYEKLVVTGGTAQGLVSIPNDVNYMKIRVESATTTGIIVRYNLLGTSKAPTVTDGMALSYLDLFDVVGKPNIINFRVIAVSATHTLHVQYFK